MKKTMRGSPRSVTSSAPGHRFRRALGHEAWQGEAAGRGEARRHKKTLAMESFE